jgi:DNA-binding beta-propeller fold protein YncE
VWHHLVIVLRRPSLQRRPIQQSIQMYDLQTFTIRQETLKVNGLGDHWLNRLAVCFVNKFLYVSDHVNAAVYIVQLEVDNKIAKWSVSDGPSGLSINNASNLLVACWRYKKIQEYTSSGSLVREILLRSNDGNFLSPLHAIQMTNGQFVVSCWCLNSGVHDVVEVDANGQVVVSYSKQLQSTTQQYFSWPRHLAVDKNNECILVADCFNKRVVLLSRSMNCNAREFNVMSVDGGLQYPQCLHLNESQGRLFVGECNHMSDGCQRRILVFDKIVNLANSFH